jgi:DNA-binding transcriptional LysR family regulator
MRRFNGPTLDVGILTGWDDVRIFLAVATSPSFSVAAQILGTTPSTITRRIAIIEKRAQVNLFRRQATGIELTIEGTALVSVAREMADAAGRFQERLMRLTDDAHGTIRISAGEGIANYVLPPRLIQLKARRPNLTMRVVIHDGASTEVDDSSDLFVFMTDDALELMQNPDLICRKVGQHHFVPYTHRDHIERTGYVRSDKATPDLADLKRCDLVHHAEYDRCSNFAPWNTLVRKRGGSQSLIEVDSTTGIINMLQLNGGVTLMPNYSRQVRPDLVLLDPAFPALSLDLIVVVSKERYQIKPVQIAFDFLSGVFLDHKSWFGALQNVEETNTAELERLLSA